MAKGFKHGAGGASLNFKVVGNPKPANPRENTIWVDTDRINDHYFSTTQPENMAEYDVWILTGTSSTVAFSATKKNPIMVYPIYAKQYIGGACVEKTAEIYQGGEWKKVGFTIFTSGSGAVVPLKTVQSDNGRISVTNDYIELSFTSAASGESGFATEQPIDLTAFTKLTIDIICTAVNPSNAEYSRLCVLGKPIGAKYGENNFVSTYIVPADPNRRKHVLDISGFEGEYYVGYHCIANAKVYNFYLE